MRIPKQLWFGAIMSSILALSMIGVAPAAASAADECRGGGANYWLENPWPEAFKVPKLFRLPNGKRAVVRKWTKFDNVFSYRGGRKAEGKIFPGKTLNQVLKLPGNTAKKGLARQSIAALLNAGEKENNFGTSKFRVIRDFQIYWDGTADMGPKAARNTMKVRMADRNAGACP